MNDKEMIRLILVSKNDEQVVEMDYVSLARGVLELVALYTGKQGLKARVLTGTLFRT